MTVTTPPAATTPSAANTGNAVAVNNGLASVANNYQTFLKLLTTQLKNQDPLSPLDTNQFTQQLTQMTGVEQQLLSNQLLQQLVTQNQGSGLTAGVGLIGKTVTANDATSTLQGGSASWEFSLASPPSSITASVFDSSNNLVWSSPLTPGGAGAQMFTWNGKNQSGVQQADGGAYTLRIAATDASGASIPVSTTLQGVATGVDEVGGQTMVAVGPVQVPLSAVSAVN
jgi:flagellar basal-body rod modification protein FlgD